MFPALKDVGSPDPDGEFLDPSRLQEKTASVLLLQQQEAVNVFLGP